MKHQRVTEITLQKLQWRIMRGVSPNKAYTIKLLIIVTEVIQPWCTSFKIRLFSCFFNEQYLFISTLLFPRWNSTIYE